MTIHLNRAGIEVSPGTVHRHMDDGGSSDDFPVRSHRTIMVAKGGIQAKDLHDRNLTAPCTNRVFLAYFTSKRLTRFGPLASTRQDRWGEHKVIDHCR